MKPRTPGELKTAIHEKSEELIALIDQISEMEVQHIPGVKNPTVVKDSYVIEARHRIREAIWFAKEAADRI